MRNGAVKMHKRQISEPIPVLFHSRRHQAKAVRRATIAPAVRRFVPGIVTISHVQAERVMVAEIGHAIATVEPRRQPDAVAQLYAVAQLRFVAL